MPFLNEGQEPVNTVKSIYATCDPSLIDIIAIDDFSTDNPTDFSEFPEVKFVQNNQRIGVAESRQIGVEMAETPYVLIIDGHMRFRNDHWYERITTALAKEPTTVFCTTCVHLTPDQMDMNLATGKYYGANLVFVDPTQANSKIAGQIIEPKWAKEQEGNEYEIPCVLGANYAMTKAWFLKIRGLKGLQKWGGDEAFLSLKTWLAGGKCKLIKDIEIGHMFREHAPYRTHMYHMFYNKMWICYTLFPNDLSGYLISKLPNGTEFYLSHKEICNHTDRINEYQSYFNSIFTRSLAEVCKLIDMELPINEASMN